ncbi:MAG: tyrosine-type recombinase/integrase [Solirubrobacterales bacterium]|nr:tyrosine-type recombinase/integrase [Solirubrobacterales bacterium]
MTGARISELCGLTWADVTLDDLDEAEITFGFQVDRHGHRRPTKTDGSARTVPIPRELALILARHMSATNDSRQEAFVFATCTGRPLGQRNVARELRRHSSARPAITDSRRSRSSTRRMPPAPDPGTGRFGAVDALVPAHRRLGGAARGRERGRGRLLPRPPGRDRHACRLHPRDRRRPPAAHAPLKDDGRVRRGPLYRPRRRGVEHRQSPDQAPSLRDWSGGACCFNRLPNGFHPRPRNPETPEPTPGFEPGTPSLRVAPLQGICRS